jgi:hypothetical protein
MGSGGKQPLNQLLAVGAAHQRCFVRRRKRVEDDRAKVAEEEARVKELRARRSRAGKERLARISEKTLREWQGTMDGGRILTSQPKKKRGPKRLRKLNRLESGGGSVASFFFVAPLSSPGSSSHPPLRRCVTSGARAAALAALVARNARVAAALCCSVCVRRIFHAMNEFKGHGGCCYTCAGCLWSSYQNAASACQQENGEGPSSPPSSIPSFSSPSSSAFFSFSFSSFYSLP